MAADRKPSIDPDWAWQRYRPSDAMPWTIERASHAHRRLGFAAPWKTLQHDLKAGPDATLARLLKPDEASVATFYSEAKSMAQAVLVSRERLELPAWWLYAMVHTPHPALEKMTLFWHGHFATSAAKVSEPKLMYRQNENLRRYALTKFGPMLSDMARDPAMLIWLDSTTNRKSHPNENFAREVMELFSLGLGNYTEQDIQEAARAFTGWELRLGQFRVNTYQHDTAAKNILGQKGEFDGDDCLRILLEQPAAAEFLTRKIYRWLVSESEEPSKELIKPLADGLRQRNYDLSWLVETIGRSNLFFSTHALGQRIKGPVELAVGMVRALESPVSYYALATDLEKLGQSVFFPPNVKGWNGGPEWISSSSLVARANWVWSLVGGRDNRYGDTIKLTELAALDDVDRPAELVDRLLSLLVGVSVPADVRVQLTSLAADTSDGERTRRARLIHAIGTLPEFQMT